MPQRFYSWPPKVTHWLELPVRFENRHWSRTWSRGPPQTLSAALRLSTQEQVVANQPSSHTGNTISHLPLSLRALGSCSARVWPLLMLLDTLGRGGAKTLHAAGSPCFPISG